MGRRAKGKRLWALILCWALLALPAAGLAKDYVVTFVKETYKAGQPAKNQTPPQMYHTWSVKTEFGNKLLVLVGDDQVRRTWLQEFSKDFDLFLVKVPEKDSGAFELNTILEIDVNDIHPIDSAFLETGKETDKKKKKK